MGKTGKSQIVLAVAAVFAAAVLFVTYGTVLLEAPFAHVQLNGPTTADSDGKTTAVVDSESRRALIINGDNDLTGVIGCTTIDSPIDAITDVCVSSGNVYVAGVRFEPDSDTISLERVVRYDKGGNLRGTVYEMQGTLKTEPAIQALCETPEGIALAYNKKDTLTFSVIGNGSETELKTIENDGLPVFDTALSYGTEGHFATLSIRGLLDDGKTKYTSDVYDGHVFTAIDLDDDGNLYACDDTTGNLFFISSNESNTREIVPGSGYDDVHVNGEALSLCDLESATVTLADLEGNVTSSFTQVEPSAGFAARMTLVWICGIYLVVLALVLAARKARRMVKEGKTENIGPMLLAVAVVSAIAVAVGSMSNASYEASFMQRAKEINMCADYLAHAAPTLSEDVENIATRNGIRDDDDKPLMTMDLATTSRSALSVVYAANVNGIGMFFNIYGKDDRGVFYLCGSANEHVLGTSARMQNADELKSAFETDYANEGELLKGSTLRDASQYRLVQIPSQDGKSIVGVIEVGSKMRSFEQSIAGSLAQRVLALLVMTLVVYLTYSELRACGRCLFAYRNRQRREPTGAIAVLTRPFTLAITMLSSIDSVMTVLIARDLLSGADMGASGPLLGLPAVMMGVGLVIGQGLYGALGSRVGLRKLMTGGAIAMLICAGLAAATVLSGSFWAYCAAKLAIAAPFGMLYALGYSLPRIADDDETRSLAAGGVKRTDTSAAALGTVLGGYAAQALGNEWVYVLVAGACLPVILMAFNLLPRGIGPLESLAQPDSGNGRIRDFARTPFALCIALCIVPPATLAAGYASLIFPIFSTNLGLSKPDINNIVVLGQLVVYVSISAIDRVEGRHGKWRVTTAAILALGVVFLLFSVNTTLVWSVAVIALVALLGKSSDGWKAMWLKAAGEADVPTGPATSTMFSIRSLALVAQPFILGALIGAANSVVVIVIGVVCVACAGLFFLITRNTSLAKGGGA